MGWMCLAREVLGGVLSVFKLELKNIIRRCQKEEHLQKKWWLKGEKKNFVGVFQQNGK